MRGWITPFAFFAAMGVLMAAAAHAQDTGATSSGNWEDPTIWTAGTVPGSTNNVYIGSTYPSGAASVATVTLTASESAANLYLGNGNSTNGTLDLGANTLTISGAFVIGQNGGIGTVNESGGSFTASNLYLESASTFTFGTKDVVNTLSVYSGSTATTTATGNVTGYVNVLSGSTLNLGANLSIAGSLDVENTGSVVHMNGNNISADTILLGWYGNQAVTLDQGTTPGSLTAANLYVADTTLNLLTSDKVTNFFLSNSTTTLNSGVAVSLLQLQSGSTGTTTTAGNITDNVNVLSGSTLNMGANLTLTGTMDVENTASVVHMNGNDISANTILLGWYGNQAVTLDRGTTSGSLTATNLYVADNTLNLLTSDKVTNFFLSNSTTTLNSGVAVSLLQLQSGSTGTTTTAGNVTDNVNVLSGSTLNMGANLTLTGTMDVENTGSIVHMNGNNISAATILLGWYGNQAVTLDRGTTPGSLAATNLYVADNTLNLLTSDKVTNFYLSNSTTTLNSGVAVSFLQLQDGSTGTTTTAGNVTDNVNVLSGSTLNMGANLTLTGTMDVENTGSVVHMNGNNISAATILLGWYSDQAVTLDRGTTPGSLDATNLYVGGGNTLPLIAADVITNLNVGAASSVTTAAAGNVTGNVNVSGGSTLNLGANLVLSGNIDVEGKGSLLDGHGFNISAGQMTVGYFGTDAVNVANVGTVTLDSLYLGHGSTMSVGGGVVSSLINLSGGSILTVNETNGTGLTLNGTSLSSLTIDPSSMDLVFSASGWDFRWQDPSSGGNWISTLDSMIAAGQIDISLPPGATYSVYDSGGYTYIGATLAAVPEPSSLVLACLAGVGVAIGMRLRSRRAGR